MHQSNNHDLGAVSASADPQLHAKATAHDMVLDSTADTTSELLKSYQALKAQHTALQADVKVRLPYSGRHPLCQEPAVACDERTRCDISCMQAGMLTHSTVSATDSHTRHESMIRPSLPNQVGQMLSVAS